MISITPEKLRVLTMQPLLLLTNKKSSSDVIKPNDYRIVGCSYLMKSFSGLYLVTRSKRVSRLWDFNTTSFSQKGYRFEGSEEYFIDLLPGKSYMMQRMGECPDQLATEIVPLLLAKLKQPFSYRRRQRQNYVEGMTDIALVDWCTVQEYGARSSPPTSGAFTATTDLRRNLIVCIFKIVLNVSTANSISSDSFILRRRFTASRHLKRLASRCDCHILRAHRSRMTLSMYSFVASQPSIHMKVDLSSEPDETSSLSEENEQCLQQMLNFIDAEVLHERVFVLHKPLGVVSSTVDDAEAEGVREGRPTVYDLVHKAGFPTSFSMVGRLDADTSGLVTFTDDSQLARTIRDPDPPDKERVEPWAAERRRLKTKEYVLTLLTGGAVLRQRKARLALSADVDAVHAAEEAELLRTLTEPFVFRKANVEVQVSRSEAQIIRRFQDPAHTMGRPDLGLGWCLEVRVLLREGKHHQIRRAVKRTGFILLHLGRERMAGISLQAKVPQPGQCSWLSHEEVLRIREGLGLDSFI